MYKNGTVHIDRRRITKALKEYIDAPEFRKAYTHTWKKYFDMYTPGGEQGNLASTAILDENTMEIQYTAPYSHYMYEGIVYVDPDYGVSGWYIASSDRWVSRRGITKVPDETQSFVFANPLSSDHWDKVAYQNNKFDVINDMNNIIKTLPVKRVE